jgi:3-dehydroquinate dehydratase
MPKVLVIHGAGMNMRGKVQLDIFGPMNPIRRSPASQTAAVSQSIVAGFGVAGYALALRGIRDRLATKA